MLCVDMLSSVGIHILPRRVVATRPFCCHGHCEISGTVVFTEVSTPYSPLEHVKDAYFDGHHCT